MRSGRLSFREGGRGLPHYAAEIQHEYAAGASVLGPMRAVLLTAELLCLTAELLRRIWTELFMVGQPIA